jgi:hypothetical protein
VVEVVVVGEVRLAKLDREALEMAKKTKAIFSVSNAGDMDTMQIDVQERRRGRRAWNRLCCMLN